MGVLVGHFKEGHNSHSMLRNLVDRRWAKAAEETPCSQRTGSTKMRYNIYQQ